MTTMGDLIKQNDIIEYLVAIPEKKGQTFKALIEQVGTIFPYFANGAYYYAAGYHRQPGQGRSQARPGRKVPLSINPQAKAEQANSLDDLLAPTTNAQ